MIRTTAVTAPKIQSRAIAICGRNRGPADREHVPPSHRVAWDSMSAARTSATSGAGRGVPATIGAVGAVRRGVVADGVGGDHRIHSSEVVVKRVRIDRLFHELRQLLGNREGQPTIGPARSGTSR